MAKKIDEETMLENIENLRSELSETKGYNIKSNYNDCRSFNV